MTVELNRQDLKIIEQALEQEGSVFRQAGLLLESLLCKSFNPKAKKLAFLGCLILLSSAGFRLDAVQKKALVSAIIKVSKERPEFHKIKRWIRYVATGN